MTHQGPGALATQASETHAQGSQGRNDQQGTDNQEQNTNPLKQVLEIKQEKKQLVRSPLL